MKKIELDLPVYTFHIDFAGHVSNIVYIQWMEIGRLKLLEAAKMPVEQLTQRDIVPVLVSTEIEYKVPLILGSTAGPCVLIGCLMRCGLLLNPI